MKFLEALDHFNDLDMRHATLLKPDAQTVSQIQDQLKRKGAPDRCYVICANEDIDGSEMSLTKALEEALGKGSGTIISCIPGKLAYFEGEDQNDRYILHHTA